jgi:ubiquinone/menaquinone biosynthesis C-methylase UbiE
MAATPFTDPAQYRPLYHTVSRIAQRTAALHAAKTTGPDAGATIGDLAVAAHPAARTIVDVGCGRGTTTQHLSQRHPHANLIAADLSTAALRAAQQRTTAAAICVDFHQLPIATGSVDLVVAAFCLYHSPYPSTVVAEIARCLTPDGKAVFATKSADSYHELDLLVASSEVDPAAHRRPSLYTTFHSGNAEQQISQHLQVQRVEHQRHVFRFRDLDHVAAYLATSPKYQLPDSIGGDQHRLGNELRCRMADQPVTTTSIVTYLVAEKP